MVDQTISYNDKSIARGGRGKRSTQFTKIVLFSKGTTAEYKISLHRSCSHLRELQNHPLHLKNHSQSENRSSHRSTPIKTKNQKKKKISRKGKGKRRRESANEKEKEKKEEKGKEEKIKEEKMERAVLKVFFEYTAPSRYIP